MSLPTSFANGGDVETVQSGDTMAEYFFDAELGDNNNVGTSWGEAWRTMEAFWDNTFGTGDVLWWRDDQIYYYVGADGNPLTESFKNAENGFTMRRSGDGTLRPSLRALKLVTGWSETSPGSGIWSYDTAWTGTEAGTWLWVDGLSRPKATWDTDAATTFDGEPDLSFAVHDVGNVLYVKSGSQPTMYRIEASANGECCQHLLRFFDIDDVVFDGIDFRGGYQTMLRYTPNTDGGVNSGLIWRNCELGRFPATGIGMFTVGPGNTAKYDFEIDTCSFTECPESGGVGIFLRDCQAATGHIINCHDTGFYKCDHGMQLGNWNGTTGGHVTGSVTRCLFLETRDDGIWTQGTAPSSGTLDIDYNVMISVGDQGLQFTGPAADTLKSVRLRNNTIVGANQEGILLYACDSSCEAKNNLLYNNNRQDVASQRSNDYDYTVEVAASGGACDYNLVYSDKNNVTGKFLVASKVDNPITAETVYDDDWAGYVAASGQDANSLNVDPMLSAVVPTKVGECRPRWNSPVVGVGTDVGLTTDYEGRPVGSTPTIGALQPTGLPSLGALGAV